MVRSDDTFWNYVEDMNDGSMKCKSCGHLFAKDTSISRIKWHLSGERGHGVAICGQVPKEVQEAAFQAMCGGNKRRKSIANSSNYDVTNTISTSGQEQSSEGRHVEMAQALPVFIGEHTQGSDLIGGIELVHNTQETRPITEQASQDMELTWERSIPGELLHAFETMPRTEQVQHLERGSSLERPLINQVDEPRRNSSRPVVRELEQSNVVDNMAADVGRIQAGFQGMELLVGEERICSLLEVANGVENAVEGSIQHVDRSVSPRRLTIDEDENREEATLRIDLVDQLAGESWDKIIAVSTLNECETFLMEEKEDVDKMHKGSPRHIPITVEETDVGCLRKLEGLACHFEDYSALVEFFKSRDKSQLLKNYRLFVGTFDGDVFSNMMRHSMMEQVFTYTNKAVCFGNLRIDKARDFQVMLPKDIQQPIIYKCCDFSSLIIHATKLEVIHIWDCNNMECLVSSSWFYSAPLTMPSYNGIFSGLKKLDCYNCKSIKKLFPPMLLPNLVNLERIRVVRCDKMEEIIGTRSNEEGVMGEESNDSNTKFSLPKLRSLELYYLSKLKNICSAKLVCNSLLRIDINCCRKLKRMPIFLPLLENGQTSALPSLEEIRVRECEKMKEIIRTRSDEEGVMDEESYDSNIKFSLPKLRRLELWNLPELKSFCSPKLICNSLQQIDIINCFHPLPLLLEKSIYIQKNDGTQ